MQTDRIKKLVIDVARMLLIPLVVYLVLFVLAKATGRNFGSLPQIWQILRNSMMITTLGFGYSFMSLSGRFDFSVGPIIMVTGLATGVFVLRFGLPAWVVIPFAILVCLCLCLVFTRIYLFMRVPSMVFSLGVVYVLEAIGVKINNGTVTVGSKYTAIGEVPWLIIIPLVCMLAHHLILTRTKVGYNIRAIGANQRIAKTAGVDVPRTFMASAILMGIFLGIGSALYLCYNGYLRMQLQMTSCTVLWEAMYVAMIAEFIAGHQSSRLSFAMLVSAFTQKMLLAGVVSLGINASWSDALRGLFFLLMIFIGVQSDKREIKLRERHRALELVSKTV